MNKAPLSRTVTVRNPNGLHARPADLLVRLASKFESNIWIGKDGEQVDCKSILSVLTLAAAQGTVLSLSADGNDAADALDSITQLFETGFDDTNPVQGAEPAVDS